MSDSKSPLWQWLRLRWKLVLNVVTILALAIFVWAARKDLAATIDNLGNVNTWYLLLMIPIEALNYHAQTKMYQGLFKVVGNDIPYKFLYKLSVELNFVNHVFPSGGAAGISYFGLRLKNDEISGSKATLMQFMKLGLIFISYEIILLFGMFSLAIMGRVNNLTILVGTSISILLVVATGAFAYIVGSQARINNFFMGLTRALNRLIQVVRPKHPETINIIKAKLIFDDFHHNYRKLRDSVPDLGKPFWYAMLATVTEVLVIYVVFMGFGHFVNIGAVILAYGVANFAGAVSVLPGGVGIYEFLMTAIMATAGVPASLTLPVVIMYRFVNTLIQVPPGYVLYQRNLSRTEKQQVKEL